MKLLSKLILVVASSSLLGLSTAARADLDYTYQFEASSGHATAVDGSKVTIDSATDLPVGWDLTYTIGSNTYTLDSALTATTSKSAPGTVYGPGTDIIFAGATGFVGSFEILAEPGIGRYLILYDDNATLAFSSVEYFNPLSSSFDQTQGSWTKQSSSSTTSVPDAANTFALLLAGAGAVGVWRRRMGAGLSGRR